MHKFKKQLSYSIKCLCGPNFSFFTTVIVISFEVDYLLNRWSYSNIRNLWFPATFITGKNWSDFWLQRKKTPEKLISPYYSRLSLLLMFNLVVLKSATLFRKLNQNSKRKFNSSNVFLLFLMSSHLTLPYSITFLYRVVVDALTIILSAKHLTNRLHLHLPTYF